MAIRKSGISGIPFGNTAARPASPSTGQPYFNGEEKRLELYTSAGWQNIVSETPGVLSISGNYSEAINSGTIAITGTNFTTGAIASATGTNGVEVQASSTTVNSLVSVTAVFTGLSNAQEPYDIKITNTSNLFGILPDALYINASPVWVTASGSLGTFYEQVAVSVSATATDSDSTISYAVASGSSLPSGVSLNSSTGLISGTLPDIASNTTYTFTINASDGVNIIPRSFSISSNVNQAPTWSTSSGTLATIYNSGRTNYSTSVSASDTESNTLTYSLVSGTLPPSMTLNTSTGVISGTTTSVGTDTTYSFVLGVSDGTNSVVTRSFNIIVKAPFTETLSGSGTFTAPSTTAITVEMLGGGGGGAAGYESWAGGGGGGGYLLATYNVTGGTSYSYSVGSAGPGQTVCNNSTHTTIGKGGNSTFGTLITAGGNGGNANMTGGEGGTNTTTGAASVIKNYGAQNGGNNTGNVGGFGGSNGLMNGESVSTYGAGAAGVANGTAGTHATGNGNGGAGGPSCQGGTHRGGGNGSAGIIKITY